MAVVASDLQPIIRFWWWYVLRIWIWALSMNLFFVRILLLFILNLIVHFCALIGLVVYCVCRFVCVRMFVCWMPMKREFDGIRHPRKQNVMNDVNISNQMARFLLLHLIQFDWKQWTIPLDYEIHEFAWFSDSLLLLLLPLWIVFIVIVEVVSEQHYVM